MTTINGTLVNGTIVPNTSYSDSLGMDYNGTSFCAVRPLDLYNPDARVIASPLQKVVQLQSSSFTIPSTVFGIHFNRWYAGASNETTVPSNLTMPIVRSHDGGVRWSQLNPSSGVYNWSNLDSWLSRVEARGAIPIYTVFGSPTWASARPTEIGAYGPGSPGLSAEPASLTYLSDFLTALVARYGTRITHFEVWNETNLSSFFSGTNSNLADIVATVYNATSGVAGRKILSPSVTGWLNTAVDTYFINMMNTTSAITSLPIKSMCDYASVHLYIGGNYTNSLVGIVNRIKTALTTLGISSKPIWDTESNLISPDLVSYTDKEGAKRLRRHIATIAALGIPVSCQYTYDHVTMGWNTRPTIFTARETLVSELSGKTFNEAFLTYTGEVVFKSGTETVIVS